MTGDQTNQSPAPGCGSLLSVSPKEKHTLERNTIYCRAALDLIRKVEDESVDLIVCDGPYGVTQNDWDRIPSIQEFNLDLIRRFALKLKDGGALYLFGKPDCIDFIDSRPFLDLRSKIVWYQPSRLAQGRLNYTNNHDIICYFIKGKRPRCYNLDAIRVAQLVELEHRLRCERVPSVTNGQYGKTKFNERGKNPGDVWGDIKQLTYKSKELVSRDALNTIQKPERLLERIVLASSLPGDLVLDPFAGVGTCPVVCKKNARDFLAFELEPQFARAAEQRLSELDGGQKILQFSHLVMKRCRQSASDPARAPSPRAPAKLLEGTSGWYSRLTRPVSESV